MPKKQPVTQVQTEINLENVSFQGDTELGAVEGLVYDPERETIWASIEQMSTLFRISSEEINKQLRNIFKEGELDEASVFKKFPVVSKDGRNYKVFHYNLDVVISVGYRVNSRQATKFRQWATNILKNYIIQGYAINERRLEEDPNALKGLGAKVRKLRTKEKNIYEAVRSCFKISSVDYDEKSPKTRSFYAKLQDKFTYAITESTAAEIVLERADGMKDFMGLTSTKSGRPSKQDAKIGKNYLNSEELYALHLLCEQFLLFAESRAIRGHEIKMKEMNEKFDQLLEVQGYPVFRRYENYVKEHAVKHAELEYKKYKQRMRIEKKTLQGKKKAK